MCYHALPCHNRAMVHAVLQAARLAGLERQYNKDLKEMLDEAARYRHLQCRCNTAGLVPPAGSCAATCLQYGLYAVVCNVLA